LPQPATTATCLSPEVVSQGVAPG